MRNHWIDNVTMREPIVHASVGVIAEKGLRMSKAMAVYWDYSDSVWLVVDQHLNCWAEAIRVYASIPDSVTPVMLNIEHPVIGNRRWEFNATPSTHKMMWDGKQGVALGVKESSIFKDIETAITSIHQAKCKIINHGLAELIEANMKGKR